MPVIGPTSTCHDSSLTANLVSTTAVLLAFPAKTASKVPERYDASARCYLMSCPSRAPTLPRDLQFSKFRPIYANQGREIHKMLRKGLKYLRDNDLIVFSFYQPTQPRQLRKCVPRALLDPVKSCHASSRMCPGVLIFAPFCSMVAEAVSLSIEGALGAAVKSQACQALHICQSRFHEIIGLCERVRIIA